MRSLLRTWCVLVALGVAFGVVGSGAAARANGRIVFAAGTLPAGGGSITRSVYVVAANGSGKVRLTTGHDDGGPAWSPDGTKIAFTSDREGQHAVFVMNADGSDPVRLTHGAGGAWQGESAPAWSPTGSRIAFMRGRGDGENNDVYIISSAGGAEKLWQRDASSPSWSPDGSRIAFSSWNGNHLYIASASGGARKLVIARSGLAYEQAPAWSPDGKRLVFTGDTADKPQVWIVNVDGTGQKQLTSTRTVKGDPTWSPDGTRILYTDGTKLVSIKPDGTGATILVSGTGMTFEPSWAAGAGAAKGSGAGASSGPHRCTIDGAKTGHWTTPLRGTTRRYWLIVGTAGADVICGTARNDLIRPGAGNDVVYAGPGDDIMQDSPGNDKLYGEAGNDALYDGDGADLLVGGPGNDAFNAVDPAGQASPDTLQGGAGDDGFATLDRQKDVVDGGAGNDNAYRDADVDVLTNIEQTVGPGGQPAP